MIKPGTCFKVREQKKAEREKTTRKNTHSKMCGTVAKLEMKKENKKAWLQALRRLLKALGQMVMSPRSRSSACENL